MVCRNDELVRPCSETKEIFHRDVDSLHRDGERLAKKSSSPRQRWRQVPTRHQAQGLLASFCAEKREFGVLRVCLVEVGRRRFEYLLVNVSLTQQSHALKWLDQVVDRSR